MSWNLWWRHGPWEQRRQAITATLAGIRPDLCGFQEVWGGPEENLAIDLAGRLGMHWCFVEAAKARDPGTTDLTYGPGRSALRIAQVRALARFIEEHSAGCAYPPVVTGDLNAEPDSDELRLLGGMLTDPAVPGLVLLDSWRYAPPGDPGFTWDNRNGHQADSLIPDSRIDYILVGLPRQGRGKVESAGLAGAAVAGVWPSDHFAVVADLRQ